VWWIDLHWLSDSHTATLSLPSSTGWQEIIGCKGLWVKIKTGRLLTCYCHRQNRVKQSKTE